MLTKMIKVMYSIVYQHYTWVVISNETGVSIVCFPNQLGAAKWIENKVASLDSYRIRQNNSRTFMLTK
jgi:hypothetical protein